MARDVGEVAVGVVGQTNRGWTYNIDTTVPRDGDDRVEGTKIDTCREQILSVWRFASRDVAKAGGGRNCDIPTTLMLAVWRGEEDVWRGTVNKRTMLSQR